MKYTKLDYKVDVKPLEIALYKHSDVFDRFTFRKDHPMSPHKEMQDVIFRYNDQKNFNGCREDFNKDHDAVWYPAANEVPEIKDIVFKIMAEERGERLGMVLCTKLPPGGEIYPHVDLGWHASYYNKYYVPVKNKPGAVFCFEGGELEPEEGEVYRFRNDTPHWVYNKSTHDRIALVICIKVES